MGSKKDILLSRDDFRNSVFTRDKNCCVICNERAKDAHHIIERRLFTDGGYYLANGASLCSKHHIMAEETTLDCEDIRKACKIDHIVLPEHMYDDLTYDKWGNIILPTGQRIRGELFYDESVQKILEQGGVLHLFQRYVKYPRTYHLPWSQMGKDDRMLKSDEQFQNKEVVVTIKMDGENTTMYNDYIHARSLDSGSHPSRDWVKGKWASISYMLDDDLRICGENLYAVHTMKYEDLPSYFMIFSMWYRFTCLSWTETCEFAQLLGLPTVPVIYQGQYDKEKIITAFEPYRKTHEGYVIRLANEFSYVDFRKSIAKFVNPEFKQALNQSHGHWISKKMETNSLSNV